ncbi:GntR family transcriptional regulator [Cryobacterium lactosi]|uniref:GntR family transcriptional regulator n=1 Tax=Cryobacterium lactosi TaxID=1259202 RepID=A0A4R9BQ65_9MICO|nr:GntR family transcriptional regulator [Cryobacterium lactosi]TFD88625.1 GntR family transcriptional regulator [Cryobacterium lactosi]
MTNVLASQTVLLYDRLRAAILSLDLAPGERLTERGLEASFDASRTPVRAALGRLDAEGLVQRVGRGWIVSPIDLAEIGALAELREAVEGAAVRLAVQRATDAQIAAVAALLEAAGPGDLAGDAEQGVRAGGDFHEQLARLSGNPAMVDTVRGALTRLARTRWLEVRTPAARAQAWQEHRAVLDALDARDADTAAQLLTGHIRGTNDRLLTALAADTRRLRGHGLAILPDTPPTAPR